MSEFDVVVLGGGPAGANAALAAASTGLNVALFDENPSAGGHLWVRDKPGRRRRHRRRQQRRSAGWRRTAA
jgi:NADPH-dependent 2,4-dienoyl-CoA reductase/sulfur reductase-like enzyme